MCTHTSSLTHRFTSHTKMTGPALLLESLSHPICATFFHFQEVLAKPHLLWEIVTSFTWRQSIYASKIDLPAHTFFDLNLFVCLLLLRVNHSVISEVNFTFYPHFCDFVTCYPILFFIPYIYHVFVTCNNVSVFTIFNHLPPLLTDRIHDRFYMDAESSSHSGGVN